jgi:UDP-N-acetylglucosamine--N-acetylmuramyl-(pentapeptide) pyrophosphoryl-undecaprenol N-acetylglucosamine transferase
VGSTFFFAGGGTGGHIYPALAIAEQLQAQAPEVAIQCFHSTRPVDERILSQTPYQHRALPATGLFFHPAKLWRFAVTFRRSYHTARGVLAESRNPVVVGIGGYVAAPVCLAGHKLDVPVVLVNVDIVPGRANRLTARWADEIFVQFEDSRSYFGRRGDRVTVVGCPLRGGFAQPERARAIADFGLDASKKVLLVTGASSGAASINEAICRLLDKLDKFADTWQIVHLTGMDHYEAVLPRYAGARIRHRVQGYYDFMPDLLAAADLVVGRSGAGSVAEYAAAGVASICMPYPHHKDMHQYLNAGKLVEVGAAVVVDDLPDVDDRVGWLWEELEDLMTHDEKRREMAEACRCVARPEAAHDIAQRLLKMAGHETIPSQRAGGIVRS